MPCNRGGWPVGDNRMHDRAGLTGAKQICLAVALSEAGPFAQRTGGFVHNASALHTTPPAHQLKAKVNNLFIFKRTGIDRVVA